ncbi:MAG: cupredoxin domain-containing protein [Cyanobacteria bacterium P01_C01_bin.118]
MLAIGLATTDCALATLAPSQQTIQTLQVHLGNQAGSLVFEPDMLTFDAGKRYKLLLDNPSPVKHYFTAKDFVDVLWTQKVEAGQVEVKGAIHELELKPGAEAEWVFIPQKPGVYELHCSIAGHAEAGMVGQLTVAASE